MKRTHVLRHAQRGAVLIIALLFLVILTILGVTAMTSTTFEERMAGNTRDRGLAFMAAEAALRDARRDINSIVVPPFPAAGARTPPISGKTGFGDGTDVDNGSCGMAGNSMGLCRPTAYNAATGMPPAILSVNMQAAPSVAYGTFTGAPQLVGVSAQPRYTLEVLCLPRHDDTLGATYCNFYRITARGYGGNPNTLVTVQEIYLKP